MIPELQVLSPEKAPRRIRIADITPQRMESLREGVIDFCKRCKSFTQAMHLWSFITRVLQGKQSSDLWWVLDGDNVESFLIMNIYPDFDGQWTGYTMFGYSKSNFGREQYRTIVDSYIRQGVTRFQFTTLRNAFAFSRWLGDEWKPAGILFQRKV